MGFSVTAAHAIFLVATLAGASTLGLAVVKAGQAETEARRVDAAQRYAEVHTVVAITNVTWDGGASRATLVLDNNGTTTLDVRLLDAVVDGTWSTDRIENGWTVDGVATNWWMPETTLTLELAPLAAEPDDIVIATEHGIKATWRD